MMSAAATVTPEERLREAGARRVPPEPLKFGRLRLLSMDHIEAAPPRAYIVKGLLSPAETSLIWGPPKCGKTFFILRLGHAIARGTPIFGRRIHGCPVLYVAAEGEPGLAARVRALLHEVGTAAGLYIIAKQVDLLHPFGDAENITKAALYVKAGVIVIDTLSRALAGGDENSPEDMGTIIRNLTTIREETKAHVAIVHHGTKNPNGSVPRGHSSLIGAADCVVEIAKANDGSRSATVTQAKDDPEGTTIGFTLRVIDLGTDPDGDPITTCLAEPAEPPPAPSAKLPDAEGKALAILLDLIAAEGTPLPAFGGFPTGPLGISENRWRDECDTRRVSTSEDRKSRSKTFKRVYAALLRRKLVATRGEIVWATHPEEATP